MATIRIHALANTVTADPSDKIPIDRDAGATRSITIANLLASALPFASTLEAQEGTVTGKPMDPAKTFSAIDAKLPNGANGRAVLASASAADSRTALSVYSIAQTDALVNTIGGVRVKSFGAIGDGTTDDSAAVASAVAALTTGSILDLQGGRYRVTTSPGHNLPDLTTVENGEFVLDGSSDQLLFYPRGTLTSLTYSGGTITAGATQLTNLSGLTAANEGQWLFIASTDAIATEGGTYNRSEWVQIDSVSGTTVNLDTAIRLTYTTSITVGLGVLKKGVSFNNVRFTGDKTKVQRAIIAEYCIDGSFNVQGYNVGDKTVGLRRCIRPKVLYRGGNPGIETDNGLDNGVAFYDGCLDVSIEGHGSALRHVVTGGERGGIDWGGYIVATGRSMKDSVVDCHPGVMSPSYIQSHCHSIRRGGMFSNQPCALMYQGGGMLTANVTADQWESSIAILQPLHNTVDAFKISVAGRGAATGATRGLDCQISKIGGVVEYLHADVTAYGMTDANSRGCNIDTFGGYSGMTINDIRVSFVGEAADIGGAIICRSNHTINRAIQTGLVSGVATGKHGFLMSNSGTFAYGVHENCTVFGASTAFGVRASGTFTRTVATGVKAYGVGGGAITTYAVNGHTEQSGNFYT